MTNILVGCCMGTATQGESAHSETASDYADVHGWKDIPSEMCCFNIKDIHIETKLLTHTYKIEISRLYSGDKKSLQDLKFNPKPL